MKLFELVAFDKPKSVKDDHGGQQEGWTEQFQDRAHFRYLRGGETVQAARLAGRQPVVITVRAHSGTRDITTDWRMRDLKRGVAYNIRSVFEREDRRYMEITAESGVAI